MVVDDVCCVVLFYFEQFSTPSNDADLAYKTKLVCGVLLFVRTHGLLHTAEILRLNSDGATSGRPAGLLST